MDQTDFVVENQEIHFINYSEAEKDFNISKLFKEWQVFSEKQKDEIERYSYVVLEIDAFTAEEAMDQAIEILELFRGLVNFSNCYGLAISTHYYGIPKPATLSIFQPPRILMLFCKNRDHLFDRFSIGFFDYSIGQLSKERNRFLSNFVSDFNSLKDCPLKKRLIQAFSKYNGGLDGNVAGTAFLEFWKVFELIALGRQRRKRHG